MTRQQFMELPEFERNIFISKLVTAIKQDNWAFLVAQKVVEQAEIEGQFDKVKFGSKIYDQNNNI